MTTPASNNTGDNSSGANAAAITAVILAGGLGTRMHSVDKSLLQWRGRPFIEHIIEQLRAHTNSVAINTNAADTSIKALGLPLLPDPFPDRRGPLAGIFAALNYSPTPLTLIVPCDNPILAPDLVARLLKALHERDAAIAYAACGADQHYLYALMRSDLRGSAEHFLQSDAAVRRWYASENAVAVDFSDTPTSFRNINTPIDLQHLPQ